MTWTTADGRGGADTMATARPGTRASRPVAQRAGQWRLERIEVLNWGTFQGHHGIDVARKGFLLTGHSGSGKSSLVDAVSAVLTPRGKLRFNAAAQDTATRGEDRSLVSYLRGAWRRSADEDTGEVTTDYLRTGATFSGVLLRYGNGLPDAKPLVLVKLYHLRRGSNTPADVAELSLLLNRDTALSAFVDQMRNGIETRRIKAAWPDALTVTDQHSAFSSKFCRALGISGENAVLLLHKTQSAKSLGSLDDLFRSFMLDRPRTFDMAENAVDQFAELSEAHRLVVDAREQVESLGALEQPAREYEESRSAAEAAAGLSAGLPRFKDAWKLEMAHHARTEAEAAVHSADHAAQLAASQVADLQDAYAVARAQVDSSGGQTLKQQREWVALAEQQERDVRERRAEVSGKLAAVDVAFPESFEQYEELRSTARAARAELEERKAAAGSLLLELHEEFAGAKARIRGLETELRSLRGRRSNIEDRLMRARTLVAEAAGLPPGVFPFAGELIDVRPEHDEWRGAIERVLRPLATVMLVPETHIGAVRDVVDGLFLGTRLVFEAVPARPEAPRSVRSSRSLVHRVDVTDGPMAGWVHSILSRVYDYECVDSPAELTGAELAVTRAGQVKRSRSRHEKDDRSRVDDRSRWVLGSDNAAKMEHLTALVQAARREAELVESRIGQAEAARDSERRRVEALEFLDTREWAQLDVEQASARTGDMRDRLEDLLASSGDLRAAEAAALEAAGRLRAAHERQDALRTDLAAAQAALAEVERVIADLVALADSPAPVPDPLAGELERRFLGIRRGITHRVIDDVALTVTNQLAAEEKRAMVAADKAARQFTELALGFKQRWPAKAGDLSASVEDRAGFLRVLAELVADRLPEFENRFFELLERQSQQNVAQLANEIRRAPAQVRDRIGPVNQSLARSVFDAGRYLRIAVKENRGELGRQFLADLQTITGSWVETERGAAEAKFEVMRRIMERLASSDAADVSWRNHCLDTRMHVRFTATEVDAEGRVVNVHDSSAGLSGGQRQKLVTFCLAAALRYQLAGDGEDVPRYGTVIMDEAFDKADSRFTRMAMDVFDEFGFHMVLATPLKLLQTLEDYIGGMAVVSCREFRDSRVGSVSIDGPVRGAEDGRTGAADGGAAGEDGPTPSGTADGRRNAPAPAARSAEDQLF